MGWNHFSLTMGWGIPLFPKPTTLFLIKFWVENTVPENFWLYFEPRKVPFGAFSTPKSAEILDYSRSGLSRDDTSIPTPVLAATQGFADFRGFFHGFCPVLGLYSLEFPGFFAKIEAFRAEMGTVRPLIPAPWARSTPSHALVQPDEVGGSRHPFCALVAAVAEHIDGYLVGHGSIHAARVQRIRVTASPARKPMRCSFISVVPG